jgi:hypothetical protein
VLPIFREALLNGGADLKELAALGMGEVIALSTDVALKPSVIHITGPLIRILGDRYGPNVKVAVLDTLTLLLTKVTSFVLRNSELIPSYRNKSSPLNNRLYHNRSAFI